MLSQWSTGFWRELRAGTRGKGRDSMSSTWKARKPSLTILPHEATSGYSLAFYWYIAVQ